MYQCNLDRATLALLLLLLFLFLLLLLLIQHFLHLFVQLLLQLHSKLSLITTYSSIPSLLAQPASFLLVLAA